MSLRVLLSPKWAVSHAFVATVAAVLVCLGFWQLHRHGERQDANARIRSAMSRPPVDLSELVPAVAGDAVGSRGRAAALPDYSVVTAVGVYLPDHEVLIGHRSYRGRPGMWLATPLELRGAGLEGGDGGVVLVVRGWVPRRGGTAGGDRDAAPPGGRVEVTGLAFASLEGGRVAVTGPDGRPELSKVDLDRFEEVSGLEVSDIWLQLSEQVPPQPELPVPVPSPELGDGPHLSYAVQWFFFFTGTVVVYSMILRRAARDRAGSG